MSLNLSPNIQCESEQQDFAIRSTLFLVFKQFGPEIFTLSAKEAWLHSRLIHFTKHLSKKPERYQTQEAFDHLWHWGIKRRASAPDVSKRRYDIELFDPGQIPESFVQKFGCMNKTCPETKHWRSLKNRSPKKFTDSDRATYMSWGRNLKLCKA
jgi:hypothetical protein